MGSCLHPLNSSGSGSGGIQEGSSAVLAGQAECLKVNNTHHSISALRLHFLEGTKLST